MTQCQTKGLLAAKIVAGVQIAGVKIQLGVKTYLGVTTCFGVKMGLGMMEELGTQLGVKICLGVKAHLGVTTRCGAKMGFGMMEELGTQPVELMLYAGTATDILDRTMSRDCGTGRRVNQQGLS